MACLDDYIETLPDKYDTVVWEGGVMLSGGQKQRLAIARAFIQKEEKITNMIEKYLKDKTYVIVTHRPKLKELCNKHYVFENHMMKEVVAI